MWQAITSQPVSVYIRLSKALIWALGLSLLTRLLVLAANDALGANPVEFIERSTGTWALVFLLLSLSITPLKQLFNLAWLMAIRRLLGLWMFAWACLHVLCYVWLDYAFDWPDIVKDVVKHPYVVVGALAWLLSIPLAITSTQKMIRRLKQRWKWLHRWVYVIAGLGLLHFLWLVKKDISEPLIYIAVFAVLMALRLPGIQTRLTRDHARMTAPF